MLGSDLAQLLSLAVDHIRDLLKVVVDKFLVGAVDQGYEERQGGGYQRKAPVGNDLDEVIRQECSEGNLTQGKISQSLPRVRCMPC